MQPQGGEYKKVDNYVYNPNTGLLGRGAFASVYKSFDESKNHFECAVKVIPASQLLANEEQYSLFMREIEVLRQIKGDNIVHLLDVKRTPNNLYIFTDYCNGGDLEKKLKKGGPLKEDEALSVLKQIVNAFIGLDNLVVKNHKGVKVAIMHRDIKPPNILFHDGVVKIADFGFAKIVDEGNKNVKLHHTLLGTPLYMNPQTLNDEAYTYKCDIWSTGIVFFESLFGRLPWTASSIVMLLRNINAKGLEFPSSFKISEDTKDLLRKMLTMKEETRIDWKGIWEHPAIQRAKMPEPSTSPKKEVVEEKEAPRPTPPTMKNSPKATEKRVDLRQALPINSPYNVYAPQVPTQFSQPQGGSPSTTATVTTTTTTTNHQSGGGTYQSAGGSYHGSYQSGGSQPTTQPSTGSYSNHLPDRKY